jgi:hypothetical protein
VCAAVEGDGVIGHQRLDVAQWILCLACKCSQFLFGLCLSITHCSDAESKQDEICFKKSDHLVIPYPNL